MGTAARRGKASTTNTYRARQRCACQHKGTEVEHAYTTAPEATPLRILTPRQAVHLLASARSTDVYETHCALAKQDVLELMVLVSTMHEQGIALAQVLRDITEGRPDHDGAHARILRRAIRVLSTGR